MALNIKHKRSAIDGKAPLPGDLQAGEIAVNYHAKSPAAYIKDSAGAVVQIAGAGAVGTAVPATETVSGTTELATQGEVDAGTDDTRSVTPLKAATRYVSKDAATGGANLPSGTTAQRPVGPTGGELRLNTTTTEFEGFDGTGWASLMQAGAATEAAAGTAAIATQAQVTAGTDDTRIVTPLKAAATFVNVAGDTMTGQLGLPGGGTGSDAITVNEVTAAINNINVPAVAKASGSVHGDGTALNPGFNATPAKDGATGAYRIIFTNPLPTNDYVVVITSTEDGTGSIDPYSNYGTGAKTVNGFKVKCINVSTSPSTPRNSAFDFVVF